MRFDDAEMMPQSLYKAELEKKEQKKVPKPVPLASVFKHSNMLPSLGAFSIAAAGLHLFSAGVDFVNPNLGGGSMLDNGESNFC